MVSNTKLQADLDSVLSENHRLRAEIKQLKEILAKHSILLPNAECTDVAALDEAATTGFHLPKPSDIDHIAGPSDKDSKVALFRSLFRRAMVLTAALWARRSILGRAKHAPDALTKFLNLLQQRLLLRAEVVRPVKHRDKGGRHLIALRSLHDTGHPKRTAGFS